MSLTKIKYSLFFSPGNSESCLAGLFEALLDEIKFPEKVISMTFFTGEGDDREIEAIRQKIDKTLQRIYSDIFYPPFLVISQPSLHVPEGILLEACLLRNEYIRISYKADGDARYTLISNNSVKEFYGMYQIQKGAYDTYECFFNAFEKVSTILKKEGMGFSNVVRQWNYIGNILGRDDVLPSGGTNYAIFNRVRTLFYEKENFCSGYPAATGIGMKHRGIGISVIAGTFPKEQLKPVSNPLQINSYQYCSEKIAPGSDSTNLPKFERALIHDSGEGETRIFVSGTAAIRGMNTVSKNNFRGQAEITFENILQLVSDFIAGRPEIKTEYVRVYLKRKDDFIKWLKLIDRVPKVFGAKLLSVLQADICRDDLLLEIESSFYLKIPDHEKEGHMVSDGCTHNVSDLRFPEISSFPGTERHI